MSDNSVHTEKRAGCIIKIQSDENCGDDSPRDWDNAGIMVCFHGRYNLGDNQPRMNPEEWLSNFVQYHCEKASDFECNNADDLPVERLWKIIENEYIFLPLYLYDHSGISISTRSFNGRAVHAEWDSSQVGWIYIAKTKAVAEWGSKRFTKTVEDKARNYLAGEVKTYDDFLTGNVYGYIIEYPDGDEDSCWGYYPDWNDKMGYEGCLREAQGIVDRWLESEDGKKWVHINETVE